MIDLPQSTGLNLPGVYNLRDIGGYSTRDGRRTRLQTFIRSESLGRLSPASQQVLVDYGIRTVIDLRKTSEILDEPDVFLDSSKVSYYHQDMIGDMVFYDKPENMTRAEHVADSYSRILDHQRASIGLTLSTLASPSILPTIYHCAGGQDRTGIISALLLGIAGVPVKVIAEDYALTALYQVNHYLSEDRPNETIPAGYSLEAFLSERCQAESMLLTIRHLEKNYGGIEEYVQEVGLNSSQREILRCALVE